MPDPIQLHKAPTIEPGRTVVVVCRLYPSQAKKLSRIGRKLSPIIPIGNSAALRWIVEHIDEDELGFKTNPEGR